MSDSEQPAPAPRQFVRCLVLLAALPVIFGLSVAYGWCTVGFRVKREFGLHFAVFLPFVVLVAAFSWLSFRLTRYRCTWLAAALGLGAGCLLIYATWVWCGVYADDESAMNGTYGPHPEDNDQQRHNRQRNLEHVRYAQRKYYVFYLGHPRFLWAYMHSIADQNLYIIQPGHAYQKYHRPYPQDTVWIPWTIWSVEMLITVLATALASAVAAGNRTFANLGARLIGEH